MASVLQEAIHWVDRPVDVSVDCGIVVGRVHSGGETREYRCTPAILVATMANMARAYAGFVAEETAKVLPFPKRRRSH
jgi:hypothetical protein